MKAFLVSAVLATSWWASWLGWDEKVEPWLYNAREQTERALTALEEGETAAAGEHLATAGRLADGDPLATFNDGTGRLLDGDHKAAIDRLQPVTETAPGELRTRALYNLGNAHLGERDPSSAIEAYKESLRLDPRQPDVKHNLEVALRQLQEQNSGQRGEQPTPDARQSGDQESSDAPGPQQPPDVEQDNRENPSENSGETAPEGNPQAGTGRSDALPQFEEQPDMTAEQAAAILEAVENLEREQRLERAREAMQRKTRGEKDW